LDQPKVSGIEVRSISASTKKVNPFPMFINCGGNTYVEKNSTRTWLSDRSFMYGTPYNYSADAIRGKITNEVYHTGRYGPIRYDIPAPVGRYEVILHFAGGVNATYSDISLEATFIRNRVNIGSMGAGLNWRPATMTRPYPVVSHIKGWSSLVPRHTYVVDILGEAWAKTPTPATYTIIPYRLDLVSNGRRWLPYPKEVERVVG
jgi:hypothetical protein